MLKISKEDLATIERQLYNKARDIDVSIYNALFDPSCKEFISDSLMLYMTKEGGMGNGLEIDNYNPNASVYQTYEAFRILSLTGYSSADDYETFQYIVNKMCNYLYNRSSMEKGLWNPLTKTNDDFAHSEEYSYLEDPFPIWGVHPTAALVGYVLEMVHPNKAYYKKALKQLPTIFSYLEEKEDLSDYDFTSFNSLLGSLKKLGCFPKEQKMLEARLKKEAYKHLEDSTFDFPTYLSNVSLDQTLQDKVEEGLDQIIRSRKSHGLWENSKGWGTNKYAEADSAALKWLGAQTVKNLYLLKQYRRIEE